MAVNPVITKLPREIYATNKIDVNIMFGNTVAVSGILKSSEIGSLCGITGYILNFKNI